MARLLPTELRCFALALLAFLASGWLGCTTCRAASSDLADERESELFGLTHRVASDRSYFLISYVAASGSSFQVDPGEPSENLPCRVNDLRLAVGSATDFGPAGVLAQASLRVGLTATSSSAAGPLEPECAALRCALFWDIARPAGGHLRLQCVHRRVRQISVPASSASASPSPDAEQTPWAASTMLEAAWGRGIGLQGVICARTTWDLGGADWTVSCPMAAYLDYRCYVNRNTYIQLGGLLGIERGSGGWLANPGVALAIGDTPGAAAGIDVSGWVRTLGWEVLVAYQPREDEPHSGTLLDQASHLTLAVRLLR